MDTMKAIKSLRAVRQFENRPIPDEALNRILEAGRWTGSAKNVQAWQFIVVRERATLEKLTTCGQFAGHLSGAALAIVIVTETNWPGTFDAGRVSQDMMLAAWDEGIGSCIASMHNQECARETLGVPAGKQLLAISFGYPQPGITPMIDGKPLRDVLAKTGRHPLDELVHQEKW